MRQLKEYEAALVSAVRKAYREKTLTIPMPYTQALRMRVQLYALRKSILADAKEPGNEYLIEIGDEFDSLLFSVPKGEDRLLITRKDATAGMEALMMAIGGAGAVQNPTEDALAASAAAAMVKAGASPTADVVPMPSSNPYYQKRE